MTAKLFRLTATIETYYYSTTGDPPDALDAWRVVQDSMADGATMMLDIRPAGSGDDMIDGWTANCLVYGDHEGDLRLDEVLP